MFLIFIFAALLVQAVQIERGYLTTSPQYGVAQQIDVGIPRVLHIVANHLQFPVDGACLCGGVLFL